MRRLLMAGASSALLPVILFISAALDSGDYRVATFSALLIATESIVFYAIFRSGLNLRARDQSLTTWIVLTAILSVALVSYWAEAERPALEMFYVMALMFGSLRLRARQLLTLSMAALAAHGAMLLLWHWNSPGEEATGSLIDLAALAIILPWVGAMGAYVNRLRVRLSESNRNLTSALAHIESIAIRDELTGLYNRRYLMDLLDRESASTKRAGRPFAVCLLDIDHFKSINDTYGHGAGDAVLRHFASVAGAAKRESDVLGRLGGEEFLVVMPGTAMDGARACAERIRKSIESSVFPEIPPKRKVTVTSGVVVVASPETPAELLARADSALYKGKAEGRNRVVMA